MKDKKREILIVSFGTSVKAARERSLDAITAAVTASVNETDPACIVEHCFTSKFVRGKIEREEGLHILSPEEAIDKAIADGVTELYAVPTHLMDGIELTKFRELLDIYRNRFEVCACAGPLAETEEDRHALIRAVAERVDVWMDGDKDIDKDIDKDMDAAKTGIVLVGHGTKDPANDLYQTLQKDLAQMGYDNYVVGTIEAKPDFEDVLQALKERKEKSSCNENGQEIERVILLPFLVVAGDHALNDIGGDEEDSWQNRLIAEGFKAETIREGLGEFAGVHQLLEAHVREMMKAEE